MNRLYILAHMDDEVLSCGGKLLAEATKGVGYTSLLTVFNRVYAYGEGSQYAGEQEAAWATVCDALGIHKAYRKYMGLVEGRPHMYDPMIVIRQIEKMLDLFKPVEVVIHDDQDRNQDHRWLSDVCKIALRTWASPSVKRVLMCQSPDGWPKETNHYVPMTMAQEHQKRELFRHYEQERRALPHPRSDIMLEALAAVAGSMCGEVYAEAYRVFYSKE